MTNEKLGGTSREVPTTEISCDSLSAIHLPEFPHRSSPVGWSVGWSVGRLVGWSVGWSVDWSIGRSCFVKLRSGESCSRPYAWLFHRELSLSPSIAIHSYGGNKAPNKRFPSRWTERTNGKSDISMPRRPPSSCFFPPPHRVLSTILRALFRPHVPPSALSILPTLSSYYLIHSSFISLPPPSPRTRSHIHRNWSLTTAKHYHIPIKILEPISNPFPSFSAISPFPLPRDTSRFSSRKWTFPHTLFQPVEKDCTKFRNDHSNCCYLYKIHLK